MIWNSFLLLFTICVVADFNSIIDDGVNNNNFNLSAQERKSVNIDIARRISRLETFKKVILILHDNNEERENLLTRINNKLIELNYAQSLF